MLSNKVLACWVQRLYLQAYTAWWTFPCAFASTKYTVQTTHYSEQSNDQTVKVAWQELGGVGIYGNQREMHQTTFAMGY